MTKKIGSIIAALAFVGASAPALAQTGSFFDKQYNFSLLKTWEFKTQHRISHDPLADNELWARMIRDEITSNLQASGFERRAERPDFLVAFYIGLRDQYVSQYMDYGFPGFRGFPGRPRFRWGWGWPDNIDIWRIPYTSSTLIIDVIDAETNMLVWRGYNVRTIDMSQPYTALDKGVDHVVKQFLKDIGRGRKTTE